MGVFWALFSKKMHLLKVDINFSDTDHTVSFKKLHPDTKDIEFVYLFIYHFVKILYVLPVKTPEKNEFFDKLKSINYTKDISVQLMTIEKELASNRFENFKLNRRFSTTIIYKNSYSRGIKSTLPVNMSPSDSLRTILIIGAESFSHIGSLESNILKTAIERQISLYINGQNPRDIKSLVQLPIDVFQYALENRNILED